MVAIEGTLLRSVLLRAGGAREHEMAERIVI